MGIHDYRFVTRWLLSATPDEVSAVLSDPAELPRWWPSVYLAAAPVSAGAEGGVGRETRLRTRGWLPYTLDWTIRISRRDDPNGFAFDAHGDFEGTGEWRFERSGAWTAATFDWRIEAKKPLLRVLAPVFRPILEANHRWAMRRGETSIRLELERRRAATEWERERLPAPPGPARGSGWVLLGTAAALVLLVASPAFRSGRRPRCR